MATEERFERWTVGLAEERRKDREEYKALWRDTQRTMADLARHVDELAVDTRLRIQELGDRLDQYAAESREADKRLDQRISDLVSAIGKHIVQGHPE